MNGLALCAGAGGLELGLHLALGDSYRCVCYVEGEAYVAGVLAARMQDGSLAPAPIWDDLRTFDGRPWRGRVDIVSAGFPCQPHSLAGARSGTADDRWLWPAVRRVVAEVEPSIVFFENVRGLLSSTGGAAFGQVLEDLAELGFVGSWGCVRAADAGAPHQRDRVFILGALPDARGLLSIGQQGWSAGPRGSGSPGTLGDGARGHMADAGGNGRKSTERGRHAEAITAAAIASLFPNTDSSGQRSSVRDLRARQPDAHGSGQDLADADERRREGERGSGLLDRERTPHGDDSHGRGLWGCDPWANWEIEPDVGRVADGVADRVDRLRAIGNGVVPQQAALAFHMLAQRIDPTRAA